jgi:hypothetical protein
MLSTPSAQMDVLAGRMLLIAVLNLTSALGTPPLDTALPTLLLPPPSPLLILPQLLLKRLALISMPTLALNKQVASLVELLVLLANCKMPLLATPTTAKWSWVPNARESAHQATAPRLTAKTFNLLPASTLSLLNALLFLSAVKLLLKLFAPPSRTSASGLLKMLPVLNNVPTCALLSETKKTAARSE